MSARREVGVAWIATYAAISAASQFIPLFPYVGGGGFVPLSIGFSALAPLILGPWAGLIATFIGSIAGFFLIPFNYPLGVVDIFTYVYPALICGLLANNNKLWKATIPVYLAFYAICYVFPYYVPGPSAGFDNPPQPLWTILTGIFYIPWIVVATTPIGTKYLPGWVRSQNRKKRYAGILITYVGSLFVYYAMWNPPYAYAYHFPVALAVACLFAYLWYWPVLGLVITGITIPILETLERSGFPRPSGAIWGGNGNN